MVSNSCNICYTHTHTHKTMTGQRIQECEVDWDELYRGFKEVKQKEEILLLDYNLNYKDNQIKK